jgi:hypothetical protein
MNLFANINNLTNHQNLGGYSGIETSPNFRKATFAMNPRNVNIGVGFNFLSWGLGGVRGHGPPHPLRPPVPG